MQRIEADFLEKGRSRGEADGCRGIGRARLELVRHLRPCRILEFDPVDHFAAAVVRRHCLEQIQPSPEHTNAHRAAHLVAGEGVEVAAERAHVHLHVRCTLRAIHEQQRTRAVHLFGDLRDRVDRAERVGHVLKRNEPRLLVQQRIELVEAVPPLVIDVDVADACADALREHLPGHEVGMVLENADDDLIAGLDVLDAPRARDQVHALGRAAHPYDLAGIAR